MSSFSHLNGGKRKVNKSLKAWVAFVKKVQKEEKLSYKDAIHRAKVRKDKGEKWMTGGYHISPPVQNPPASADGGRRKSKRGGAELVQKDDEMEIEGEVPVEETISEEVVMGPAETPYGYGGRRRTRRMRRSRGRGRTARRARGRASRRH